MVGSHSDGEVVRRRVLIIGMLDSVHFARWLEQFVDEEIDFLILPSKKFKSLHPKLIHLLEFPNLSSFKLLHNLMPIHLYGYFDFSLNVVLSRLMHLDFRLISLRRLLGKCTFTFVHCLEIQGAGYLVAKLDKSKFGNSKVIVTNWGSDIYFYHKHAEHLEQIRKCLTVADLYSAECARDYDLAKQLGFTGDFLPCIPNAGGFQFHDSSELIAPSKRSQVLIKGYGGRFGRANLIIDVLPEVMRDFPGFEFRFFSVTDDVFSQLADLSERFPGRVHFTTQKRSLPHGELLKQFMLSRVYVGSSASDGISTSFLEAIVSGAYPIQTDTSCANEWVNEGICASIVSADSHEIAQALKMALSDNSLVDSACDINLKIANMKLGRSHIQKIAQEFYG